MMAISKKYILEISDIEEVTCRFLIDYFADNSVEGFTNVQVAAEVPTDWNHKSPLIVVKKISDSSMDANFYHLQGMGFNCFGSTWTQARKLAIRVEAILNSHLFVDGNPVVRVSTSSGPIKSGSLLDAEAKAYYFATQIKTKSNVI